MRVPTKLADPESRIREWFRQLNLTIPPPEPIAIRWKPGGGTETIPVAEAIEDEDTIIGSEDFYPFDLDDLAAGVVSMVKESQMTFPGRYSWRRWTATSWLAGKLYTSGITRSGGSMGYDGADPIGGPTYTLPKWSDVPPRRNSTMRPYLLGKQSFWWECLYRQGWKIRGRHKPQKPYAFGVCAACVPCPECGALYDCQPGCACCQG